MRRLLIVIVNRLRMSKLTRWTHVIELDQIEKDTTGKVGGSENLNMSLRVQARWRRQLYLSSAFHESGWPCRINATRREDRRIKPVGGSCTFSVSEPSEIRANENKRL